MRLFRCALVLAVAGCGGRAEEPPRPPIDRGTVPPVAAPTPVKDEVPPAFAAGTRSLELRRTVGVRIEPGDDAKRIGTIAVDTRVRWTRTAKGKGCKEPWVEIEPRGWICGDYVKPSTKSAMGREVPMLDRGELVPGVYGKVTGANAMTFTLKKDKRAKDKPVTSPGDAADEGQMVEDKPVVGSMNVRQWGEVTIGKSTYWRVAKKDNEYMLRSAIREHKPSSYSGARLGDETGWALPIAFVWPRGNARSVYTFTRGSGGGGSRTIAARTPVPILETVLDAKGAPSQYRVGDADWLRAADVRVFTPRPEPATLQPGERWLDLDLDTQIVVAFEGTVPVYATMVSSGAKDTPTETGIYRMWLKESEADMRGLTGEDPYSVATVPWTQFYSPERGLALHTAYWHDQFGKVKSHGCVNLSPQDARWLYFWSDPQVPPGWTMAAGVIEAPGSIVRVRSAADPDPPVRGYAKKVLERRQQGS